MTKLKDPTKDDYLRRKVRPYDVYKVNNVEEALNSLKECGFQGRNLGMALDVLHKMVTNEEILTVMTLAGAMVPAGMGEIICTLIEHNLIDVLVTTGANITHDLVDVFSDVGHYLGSENVDDSELFKHRINRILDIFLPEENYAKAENELLALIKQLFEKSNHYPPSVFLRKLGQKIEKSCILSLAAKKRVPVFVPAMSDSEFSLNLIKYSVREGYDFQFDILGEVQIFADIIRESKEYGTIIIGGGVPRNWAQQIFPLLDQIDKIQTMGYNYSVRIHTAVEYDGGLSGCTISESKSWGKYDIDSKHVSIWCDATIVLPFLISALFEKLKIKK